MKKFLQRFFILVLLFVTIFTFVFKPKKANAFIFAIPAVTAAEYLASVAITYLAGVQISNTVDSLEVNKITSAFVHTILSVSEYDNWFYSSFNCNFYYNVGSSLYELGYDTDTNVFSFYLVSDKFNILFSNWNDSSAYDDLYDVDSNLLVSNCSKDIKPPIKPDGNKYLISASVSYYLVNLCGELSDDFVVTENGTTGTLKVDNYVSTDTYSKSFYSSSSLYYGSSDCPSQSNVNITRIAIKDSSKKFDLSFKLTEMYDSKSYSCSSTVLPDTTLGTSDLQNIKFSDLSSASYFLIYQTYNVNTYYCTISYKFDMKIIDPMNNYIVPFNTNTVTNMSYFEGNRFCDYSSQPFDHTQWSDDTRIKLDVDISSEDVFYVSDGESFSTVNVDTSTYPTDDYTVTVDPSHYNVESDSSVTSDVISQVADNVSVDEDKKTTVAGVTVENSAGDTVSDGSTSDDTDNKTFFDKILDFLKDILNAILSLPSLIAKAFEYLFEFVTDLLKNIVSIIQDILQGICDLPLNVFNLFRDILNNLVDIVSGIAEDILNGLKELFIPDATYFSSRFDALQDKLKDKLSTDSYSAIFGTSFLDRDVEDMVFDLGFTTLVIKTSYYNRFKVMLKYVFMGIFFFLMCKYNYNQVYKIFRNTSEAEVSKYIGGGE